MSVSNNRILFEDDHLLAVSKRSGELAVRGAGKLKKLPLLDFLKKDHPGIKPVNRLDFETSGIMVFAKSSAVLEQILSSDFSSWDKHYLTLVMGVISRPKGIIRRPLPARNPREKPVEAETRYTVLDRFANSTYLEVQMLTGRHHQIRRHLAGIKHPLVLDSVYGHKKFNQVFVQEFGYRKFFLHASKLSFDHPVTGEKVEIEDPLPKSFKDCIGILQSL